jgi:hypothetical protein
MLQAIGVSLRPELDLLSATIAIQRDLAGKVFEVNFVTVSPAVEAKEKNNRTMHHGSKHDGADRERSSRTKELAWRCLVAP